MIDATTPFFIVIGGSLLLLVAVPILNRVMHEPTPPPKADPNRPSTSTRRWGLNKIDNPHTRLFEKYTVSYEEYGEGVVFEFWYEPLYSVRKARCFGSQICYKEIKRFDFKAHEEAQAVCDILNKDPFYYHTPEDKAFFQVHGFYKQENLF